LRRDDSHGHDAPRRRTERSNTVANSSPIPFGASPTAFGEPDEEASMMKFESETRRVGEPPRKGNRTTDKQH